MRASRDLLGVALCAVLATLGACKRKPAGAAQSQTVATEAVAAPTAVTFGVFTRPVGHVMRTAWTSRLTMRFQKQSGDTEKTVENRSERRDKVIASTNGVPTQVEVLYEHRTQTESEDGIAHPPTADLLAGLGFDVHETSGRIQIVRRQTEPDDYLDATV